MEELSILYLFLYMLIWVVVLFWHQRRRAFFDAGSFTIITYLVYSVFSFFLYLDKDVQAEFGELTLFPFVYLFFMLMLATLPVLNFDARKVDVIVDPHKNVVILIVLFFVFFSFLSIPNTLQHIQEGITLIMLESQGGKELVQEARAEAASMGHGGLSNLPVVLSSAFCNIGIFLFFFLLAVKKYTIIKWGLGLSILLATFSSVASGSRGGPIGIATTVVATFFLFRYFYSNRVKKIFGYVGLFFALLLIIPIISITLSRFGEEGAFSSVLDYAGQENLYFNKYGLDDNGIRYGDRTIPLFKRMIGIEGVPHNYLERRQKYPELKINDEVFYTFVGDFTIDFGPFAAFILFLVFYLCVIFKTKVRNSGIHFRHLLLLHFVLCICVQGGMTLFRFADVGGNLQIIAYFLVYIYSKFTISGDRIEIQQSLKTDSKIII